MADRLVNLQSQLRAIEDQVELAFRALIGAVQRDGFFGDARGVSDEIPLVDQLVAFELMLTAKGIRIRALLDLAILISRRRVADAADVAGLVDEAAE